MASTSTTIRTGVPRGGDGASRVQGEGLWRGRRGREGNDKRVLDIGDGGGGVVLSVGCWVMCGLLGL